MKKLSLALSLAFGTTAFAEVPSLINYQGRLVDGVGNPITGPKEFKLDIYDAQTEGTLIYQETLPDITLDEDGAYSFQFGAGESRNETSAVIATGDGSSASFQYVLEQTPVGVISVTDGTNTFTSEDTPTGRESFRFTYIDSLNLIILVSNEPPADGVNFTATFRYAENGIMGALGSAAEHWMEVTIGDELQSPRQRLVAVPFALKAGSLIRSQEPRKMVIERRDRSEIPIPYDMRELVSLEMFFSRSNFGSRRDVYFIEANVIKRSPEGEDETIFSSEKRVQGDTLFDLDGWNTFDVNITLEEDFNYYLVSRQGFIDFTFGPAESWEEYNGHSVKVRYR